MKTHFQRDLGRRCAVGCVEAVTEPGQCGQTLGQLDHRFVGEPGQDDMLQRVHLLPDRLLDLRLIVAE